MIVLKNLLNNLRKLEDNFGCYRGLFGDCGNL